VQWKTYNQGNQNSCLSHSGTGRRGGILDTLLAVYPELNKEDIQAALHGKSHNLESPKKL